jgi:hypothetical protein
MGRSGDLLRQQKKKMIRYTFTGEQLEAHDKAVARAAIENRAKEMEAEAKRQAAAQIAEFNTGTAEDDFYNTIRYLYSVSCRILIERFGWKAPGKSTRGNDSRMKIARFANALSEELDKIGKSSDIRSYAAQTARMYGLDFIVSEVEE